ncbi:SAM-dependent methyltransferase [Saccharothrix sp.]|uniref:SAM-dependent methyltransferase n=1 Tax=Saccharothrix sp. TaxID=1873460 RepID=UPI002811A677|nr:SAM-dependent methyltransferase [Saccharothrix sp.]
MIDPSSAGDDVTDTSAWLPDQTTWVPDETDTTRPSAARVYDALLGGGHNFAADRAAAARIEQVLPNARRVARSNRAFLRRAVRYMASQGVTRFLDLGSGIPTVGNVHEIARDANPESRVVYVDFEAVVVAHSRLLLDGDERTAVVEADLTEPDTVLADPAVRALLDTDEPVGLLLVAVFHFVPDHKDPAGLVARYLSALPEGSFAAISHLTADHDAESMAQVAETMANSPNPMFFRPFDRVTPLFAGLDLVEPGLVDADLWRPEPGAVDPDGPARGVYAGVGRVR